MFISTFSLGPSKDEFALIRLFLLKNCQICINKDLPGEKSAKNIPKPIQKVVFFHFFSSCNAIFSVTTTQFFSPALLVNRHLTALGFVTVSTFFPNLAYLKNEGRLHAQG